MKPFNGSYPVTFTYLRRYSNGNPHKGIDFGTPQGTTLVAAVSGTVWHAGFGGGWGSAYGGQVIIKATVSGKTRYILTAHMSSISVTTGQSVKIGQAIGRSGGRPGTKGAGNSTGPHVHFQVNPTSTWSNHINPQHILDVKASSATPTKPKVTKTKKVLSWEVQASTLNLRDFPHTAFSTVKKTVKKGTVIDAEYEAKVDGQWWLQSRSGLWFAMDYVLATHDSKDTDTTVYEVNVATANLREQPSTKSRISATLEKGEKFKAAGFATGPDDSKKWLVDANHRWIRADLVSKPAAPKPPTVSEVLARSAWTNTTPGSKVVLDTAKVTRMVLHWPGSGPTALLGLTQSQVVAKLEAWRKQHVNDNGWSDIGYNYAVDGSGRIWELRGDYQGAQTENHNSTTLGVLLIVGENESPNAAMIASVNRLYALKKVKFTKMTTVTGHGSLNQTDCPGAKINSAIKAGVFTGAPVASTAGLRVGSLNVIRWRLTDKGVNYTAPNGLRIETVKKGKDYSKRVPGLVKTVHTGMRASVLFTQESGQYADGELLNDSFTNPSAWEYRLHGDAGDLTNAIHWHSKRDEVEGGKFSIEGAHHNWATWSLLKDVATSRYILMVTTHLEYRKQGEKTASEWDKLRERQTRDLITEAEALSASLTKKYRSTLIPVLFGGDFNSDGDFHAYDGPAVAMKAEGYVDAETVAITKNNVKWATLNGLKTAPFNGKRYDKFYLNPKHITVREHTTVWAAPDSDHNGVVISIVF